MCANHVCRGICNKRALPIDPRNGSAYSLGYAKCSGPCNCFFETSESHCPCCNAWLRKNGR